MGIIVMIMASMFEAQNREVQALGEKLASTDLQKTVIAALSDGSVCKYILNPPSASPLTFNTQALSPATPQTINITSPLYGSITAGSPPIPGPIVAKIGSPASDYSSSLIVKSIQLQVTSGNNGTYMGNWVIGFDSAKTVRPLRPVSVATILTVSTSAPNSPASAVITACQSGSAGTTVGSVAQGVWCGLFSGGISPNIGFGGSIIFKCQGQTPVPVQVTLGLSTISAYSESSMCPSGYALTFLGLLPTTAGNYPDLGNGWLFTCVGQ